MVPLILILGFILVICCLVSVDRRYKLKDLTASQFPEVSPEVFARWRSLELMSNTIFLWSAAIVFFIGIQVFSGNATYFVSIGLPMDEMGLSVFVYYVFLAIVLFAFSAIPGGKAAKLKKQHGIRWPK